MNSLGISMRNLILLSNEMMKYKRSFSFLSLTRFVLMNVYCRGNKKHFDIFVRFHFIWDVLSSGLFLLARINIFVRTSLRFMISISIPIENLDGIHYYIALVLIELQRKYPDNDSDFCTSAWNFPADKMKLPTFQSRVLIHH